MKNSLKAASECVSVKSVNSFDNPYKDANWIVSNWHAGDRVFLIDWTKTYNSQYYPIAANARLNGDS